PPDLGTRDPPARAKDCSVRTTCACGDLPEEAARAWNDLRKSPGRMRRISHHGTERAGPPHGRRTRRGRVSGLAEHATARALREATAMVEIEWDGVELPSDARQSVLDRLRGLANLVDPDG